MFDAFLEKWLSTESSETGKSGKARCPLSLWIYGRAEPLARFSSELLQFLAQKGRHVAVASTKRLASEVAASHGVDIDSEARTAAVARLADLQSAPFLLLRFDVANLVGEALLWTDSIVDTRYRSLRPTLAMSTIDPVAAYDHQSSGQDEFSMPRIVGRILEDGDAIEVTEDGAYCSEFVFTATAASDYRIRILKNRVGRVAVMRPRE